MMKEEKIVEAFNILSLDTAELFQSQNYKIPDDNNKTRIQQSTVSNETDFTFKKEPNEKWVPQDDEPVQFDFSLKLNDNHEKPTTTSLFNQPSFCEKYNDFNDENVQLQTILETYPSVVKQSLSFWVYDSSFF